MGILLTGLTAQVTIPSSGGNFSGSGGSVSFSIGQTIYTTNTATNGSMAQGVQQAFEISVTIGIEEAKNISLKCSVYPNPTIDILVLKVENFDIKNLSYKLFNVGGKLLENKKLESTETSIVMSRFAAGTYFLKILRTQKSVSHEIKTFKIIKNR
ncbi:conserved hypothetical protein [sediment metagenome]|uniref:Secretion system C-terminal sorting domain-containing protein n=1 Tax=sediment metagenome TaxID=749907 RepID=D9PIA1_9ZZZZ